MSRHHKTIIAMQASRGTGWLRALFWHAVEVSGCFGVFLTIVFVQIISEHDYERGETAEVTETMRAGTHRTLTSSKSYGCPTLHKHECHTSNGNKWLLNVRQNDSHEFLV